MEPDKQPQLPTLPEQPLSSTAPEAAPINYLDQISAKPVKKFGITKKPMIVGIIAAVCLLLALLISAIPKNVSPLTLLAARLSATNTVSVDVSPILKSTRLRSINSNLKMYFTNTIREIKPLLTKNEINIDKLGSTATSKESTKELMARLEDARLNGVYDRTYAREMAYKLSTIITLYKQIYKNTGDESLKAFLATTQKDIAPIQVQFAEFNADNS